MVRIHKEQHTLKRNPSRKVKKLSFSPILLNDEQKQKVLKEKNRESAQRSRDNRRKYIVGLENRISELTLENEFLKKQLSLCQCPRDESSGDNVCTQGTNCQQERIDEEKEQSVYSRVSMKSLMSCSNFLLLSLAMLFCVFGYVDVTGETAKPPTGLYSMSTLETALTNWHGALPSCNSPNPSPKYLQSHHLTQHPAEDEPSIRSLVQLQLSNNLTVIR